MPCVLRRKLPLAYRTSPRNRLPVFMPYDLTAYYEAPDHQSDPLMLQVDWAAIWDWGIR